MSLRIVEFGNGTAAGYCGRLFALRNADVIRVDSYEEVLSELLGMPRESIDRLKQKGVLADKPTI